MAQPPVVPGPPPKYTTSIAVRNGISFAYSTVFNPRGLEKIWHGPWGHTFTELVSSYQGQVLVHCQYPVWVPGLKKKEMLLKQQFQELGIDYEDDDGLDNSNDEDSDSDSNDSRRAESNNDDVGSSGSGNDRGGRGNAEEIFPLRRKSARQAKQEEARVEQEFADEQEEIRRLLVQREKLWDREIRREAASLYTGDTSVLSIKSDHDGDALDAEPDFVVSHIGAVPLPPIPEAANDEDEDEARERERVDAQRHSLHRAGRKIFHVCNRIIFELKSAPARVFKGERHRHRLSKRLNEAIEDLIRYCALYFQCNEGQDSVVAIGASGLYWCWTVVERKDVPQWDWELDTVSPQDPKYFNLSQKFSSEYMLGTKESDVQLDTINRKHIYSQISTPGHAPVPEEVQTMLNENTQA